MAACRGRRGGQQGRRENYKEWEVLKCIIMLCAGSLFAIKLIFSDKNFSGGLFFFGEEAAELGVGPLQHTCACMPHAPSFACACTPCMQLAGTQRGACAEASPSEAVL